MNFSKTTLADDFKLEIAQQSQCGKQDDVNFPKDLGSGNRNEQNETQFEKGGGGGVGRAEKTYRHLKTNHSKA